MHRFYNSVHISGRPCLRQNNKQTNDVTGKETRKACILHASHENETDRQTETERQTDRNRQTERG